MFVVFFSQWIADALCYSCIVANLSIIQFYWIEMSEIHGNEIKGKPAQTSIYRRTSFFSSASPCSSVSWFFASTRFLPRCARIAVHYCVRINKCRFCHIKLFDLYDCKVDLTINAYCAFIYLNRCRAYLHRHLSPSLTLSLCLCVWLALWCGYINNSFWRQRLSYGYCEFSLSNGRLVIDINTIAGRIFPLHILIHLITTASTLDFF